MDSNSVLYSKLVDSFFSAFWFLAGTVMTGLFNRLSKPRVYIEKVWNGYQSALRVVNIGKNPVENLKIRISMKDSQGINQSREMNQAASDVRSLGTDAMRNVSLLLPQQEEYFYNFPSETPVLVKITGEDAGSWIPLSISRTFNDA